MSGQPDYLDETSVRAYALLNLGCGSVVWVGGLLLARLGPADDLGLQCWKWVWGVGGLLTMLYLATALGLWRGGTYRIAVWDGRLEVHSPHRHFGPSFSVALVDIERLVVLHHADGVSGHEVRTRSGHAYAIGAGCGERLFEALRRLRPDLANQGPQVTPPS